MPPKKNEVELSQASVSNELNSAMNDTRASIALMDALSFFKSKKSNAHDIARAINFDPQIGERVLREVNSAVYGLQNRIKDLAHAITMLGFKRTQEILVQVTRHDMYEKVENSYFELTAFKKHGVAVGCFAEQIAKFLKLDHPKEFFKAGSLHDIGKYFYLTRASAQFEEWIKQARKENIPLYQLERQSLKTDHAEIGAIMAEEWKLPEPIIAAIRYHHEITDKQLDRLTSRETAMVQIVSFSNLLAHGQQDQGATGHRVSLKDLPPPPGIITDEDLSKIILWAESQYIDECEMAGLSDKRF